MCEPNIKLRFSFIRLAPVWFSICYLPLFAMPVNRDSYTECNEVVERFQENGYHGQSIGQTENQKQAPEKILRIFLLNHTPRGLSNVCFGI